MKYSIAIPLDLKLRPFDILRKVKDIIKRASDDIEIVFGHNDRNCWFDKYLKRLIKNKGNVKLASGNFYTKLVNMSLLRNKAVELCSCEFIYLMDVDCLFDKELSDSCIEELKSEKKTFIILPCLYLTPKGSRAIFHHSREEMFEKFISFRKDLFSSIASPSGGTIFLKKKDYLKLGGFDEDFVGRGGEDFEFMIKLALFHKAIEPTKDLMLNKFYKAPLLSEGFRKYLSFICLPYFFEKKVAFHIYHSRNRLLGYYRQYDKNSNLLQEKIAFKDDNLKAYGASLMAFYEELCHKYEIPLDKYAILFDSNKPKILSLSWFILFLKRL